MTVNQFSCGFCACDSVGTRTQGLLLRRQLLYPAELRNRVFCFCFEKSGAKLIIFYGTAKFSDPKSDVGAVVERIISFGKGFGGLERADAEGVVGALPV